MSSTTTNLGLYKPAAGENVNVTTDLNNNWDTIDAQYGAWTAMTVGITQLGNPTINRARYKKFGKTVHAQVNLTANGVQGGGAIELGLPTGAGLDQHSSYTANRENVGTCVATDASTGTTYIGFVYPTTARTFLARAHGQNDVFGPGNLPFIFASGDFLSYDIKYETA
jgi:hypothetical protein